jgi:hypothetical protein
MKETHKGLHPEVVKNWSNQSEFKDPLEFLQKVYLMKNPPKWAAKELENSKEARNHG